MDMLTKISKSIVFTMYVCLKYVYVSNSSLENSHPFTSPYYSKTQTLDKTGQLKEECYKTVGLLEASRDDAGDLTWPTTAVL